MYFQKALQDYYCYPHWTESRTGEQENKPISHNKIGISGLGLRYSDSKPMASPRAGSEARAGGLGPGWRGQGLRGRGRELCPVPLQHAAGHFIRTLPGSLLLSHAGSIGVLTPMGTWSEVNPFLWSHLSHQLFFFEFVCWASRSWEWNS